jgi:hypothetical protein
MLRRESEGSMNIEAYWYSSTQKMEVAAAYETLVHFVKLHIQEKTNIHSHYRDCF